MVTFGIPSQFLRHQNKARSVSRIRGSKSHTSTTTPTKEATLTTGLLFFPLSPSVMDRQGKYLTDYKERPVSASLISAVRKHSCLSLARLPLIWGGTEIPKWGQGTKICVLSAKQ